MRYAPVMALMALLLATTAFAGQNPLVTLPLHGKPAFDFACNGYLPVDCVSNLPQVNVPAGPVTIFLFVMNYEAVAGVQTAFVVPATWVFAVGNWACQPNQLNAVTPHAPWGPNEGTITTAFDCLNTHALGVIGSMIFQNAPSGCISQVESQFPFGTHVLDCSQGTDVILPGPLGDRRVGSVCVNAEGQPACQPVTPVEPATWGQIKASYN
jgi:hypothetical protein